MPPAYLIACDAIPATIAAPSRIQPKNPLAGAGPLDAIETTTSNTPGIARRVARVIRQPPPVFFGGGACAMVTWTGVGEGGATIGLPHPGHVGAESEISLEQSGQRMSIVQGSRGKGRTVNGRGHASSAHVARAQVAAAAIVRTDAGAIAADAANFTGTRGARRNVTCGGDGVTHAVD